MRICLLILAIVGGLAAGCERRAGEAFDGGTAFALAQEQMDFGPRIPGTDAHSEARDWIAETLQANGWEVDVQAFDYRGVELQNIVGKLGASPAGPILLGAHYDTRPKADRDLLRPDLPVPGANDGASGVAVLLELARTLPAELTGQEIWLVFFDGEDSGGLDGWEWITGSTFFAGALDEKPQSVVVVDMVGDADLELPRDPNSDPLLAAEIWSVAKEQGATAFRQGVGTSLIDDHRPFLAIGIPAVDIIDFEYPYWHTTADTLDKIAPGSLEQVGRVLQAWVLSRP